MTQSDNDSKRETLFHAIEGDVWEFYQKGAKLGSGAFGAVFKATRRSDGAELAVKTMECDLSVDVNYREMEVLLRGDHPNLIRCEALYIHKASLRQALYVVTPVYAHGDLEHYVQARSELREGEAGRLLGQLASVLLYLRDGMNCMHRDIKPANILIKSLLAVPGGGERGGGLGVGGGHSCQELGEVVLCDLGWTVIRPDEGIKLVRTQTANAGTLGWRAPEVEPVEEGGSIAQYNNKADIYSLGLVAYFCLTGAPLRTNGVEVSRQWPGRLKTTPAMRAAVQGMLDVVVDTRSTLEQVLAHPAVVAPHAAMVDGGSTAGPGEGLGVPGGGAEETLPRA